MQRNSPTESPPIRHILMSASLLAFASVLPIKSGAQPAPTVVKTTPKQAPINDTIEAGDKVDAAVKEKQAKFEAERIAAAESLATLNSLIEARKSKSATLDKLKSKLEDQLDESEQAKMLRSEIGSTENQITGLVTGVSEEDYGSAGNQAVDLQNELQQLVTPFVMMLRSATEDARQIDTLRRQLAVADRQKSLASKAVRNIEQLMMQPSSPEVSTELLGIQAVWAERYTNATDLYSSTSKLLEEKLNPSETPSVKDSEARGLSSFFVGRGLSLLIGIGVFIAVFVLFQVARWLVERVIRRISRRIQQNNEVVVQGFGQRLISLFFSIGSIIAAAVAMLAAFNARNDWVLLGITLIAMIAIAWYVIKSLPSLIQQLVIYLNIGAVQEGERVMFEGVPWQVQRLSFQSRLTNPDLAGGTFTVPISQLVGLHSRPIDADEEWFPSKKGDWVQLEEGVGQVLYQTPSMVEIQLRGGALKHFSGPEYFNQPPTNVTLGTRIEAVFGISYKHQAIATTDIPRLLREYLREGLLKLIPEEHLIKVDVETLAAGSSSIDYEVEADISGAVAMQYEELQRALVGLSIEACTKYGWEIPFPQLVMHQGTH